MSSTLELLNKGKAAAEPATMSEKTAEALGTDNKAEQAEQAEPAPAKPAPKPTTLTEITEAGHSKPDPDTIKKMKLSEVNALAKENGHEWAASMSLTDKKAELIKLWHPDAPVEEKKATVKKVDAKPASPDDLIIATAQEIENVKDAATAIAQVHDLESQRGFSDFRLGGYLSLIQTKAWFGDHSTFKEFIETETSLDYRKAMYLVSIYNGLIDADIAWEKVANVGWTKLKELVGVLSKDNVDEWVKKSSEMTTLQLVEAIKAYKKTLNPETASAPAAEAIVSTLTFKVHDDQKATINSAVEKAMGAMATEVKTVALEHICMDYLAGAPKTAKASKDAKQVPIKDQIVANPKLLAEAFTPQEILELMLKAAGEDNKMALAEMVIEAYGEVFPEVSVSADFPEEAEKA